MTSKNILKLLQNIDNGYNPLKEEQEELSQVETLDWRDIEFLPKSIVYLKSVRKIDLSGNPSKKNRLRTLPYEIGYLSSLRNLNLSSTQIKDLPESFSNLLELQELDLSNTELSRVPDAIGNLVNLQALNLSLNKITKIPVAIGQLTKLRGLNLNGTGITSIPDEIYKCAFLQQLSLNGSSITILPNTITSLTSLQVLELSGTNVNELPQMIGNLTALRTLDIKQTSITRLPDSIIQLKNLQRLDLSSTLIRELPSDIGKLPSLSFFVLNKLTLLYLPKSIIELNLPFRNVEYPVCEIDGFGIYINDLKLWNQPIEIFYKPRDLIEAYFNGQEEMLPLNECKVVFLGNSGAGKSLIIERIINDGCISDDFDGILTPGISIRSKKFPIGNEEIELHFWDFGGQFIMHSMHRPFLTNRTLYVVVTNARDNNANEQAWHWIREIMSFTNGSKILLLVNQKDQDPHVSINELGLRIECPALTDVRYVSALNDTENVFNEMIRDKICQIVANMETVNTTIPKQWFSLKNALQKNDNFYIATTKFYELCNINGITIANEIIEQILDWFTALGICLFIGKSPILDQLIFLKPEWLLNALYIVVFKGRHFSKNGVISERDFYTLLCEKDDAYGIYKVWSNIVYKPYEIPYIIAVLMNDELLYKLHNDYFFIPMLCDYNEPYKMGFSISENTVHLRYRYRFLPENVMYRLMVRHGSELDLRYVWRTGAVFARNQCGWSALVYIHDNDLEVYAKADNQETHPVYSYIEMIRESIERISTDLGLLMDEYIAYRKFGIQDYFDIRTLIGSKKHGMTKIYSSAFNEAISIDEILGIIKKTRTDPTEKVLELLLGILKNMSGRIADLVQKDETKLTSDIMAFIHPILNAKYDIEISRECSLGRSRTNIGETCLYFFQLYEFKQSMYILEVKDIQSINLSYEQLMGYLNPDFLAGITVSINRVMEWDAAFDFIYNQLEEIKETKAQFAPIFVDRVTDASGSTLYIKTEHIVPETGRIMPVYHMVLQLYNAYRKNVATKARIGNEPVNSYINYEVGTVETIKDQQYPIGVQDFEKIRMEGFVYIDKTEYIYKIVHSIPQGFLYRPRRFGKSLLLSTMKAYWEGKKELFNGLAIMKMEKDMDSWQSYPVFYFDFARRYYGTQEDLPDVIDTMLKEYEKKYVRGRKKKSLADRFQRLITQAYEKTGRRCVILIDEYDKPLLDAINDKELQEYNKTVFRGFFITLKSFDRYIKFVFITGVTKFSKLNFFSDLNHLTDISLYQDFACICGITQKELDSYFYKEIKALSDEMEMSLKNCYEELKNRYEGYQFNHKSEKVYNPYSILNCLSSKDFDSYWFESGTPTFLVKRVQASNYNVREFSDKAFYVKKNRISDYWGNDIDIVPLLYQTGYLSIQNYDWKRNLYTLGFPNDEVKYGFLQCLMDEYMSQIENKSGKDLESIRQYLERCEIDEMMNALIALIASIPYTTKDDPFEHDFQTAIYLLFTLLGQDTYAEVHNVMGRADCIVETTDYVYIFEFKRDKSAKEALEQIDCKNYALPYKADNRKIIKIGVNFDSKKRIINDWSMKKEQK